MINKPSQPKVMKSLIAIGSLLITSTMFSPNANAQTICKSGLLISTIVNYGSTGYKCELGDLQYTFYENIVELNNPNAKINFLDSRTFQKITFTDLNSQGVVAFYYDVVSPFETVTKIEMAYNQEPLFPIPFQSEVSSIPILPSSPSLGPITVETNFTPDDSLVPPYQTLTSLTHTIYKTPSPLPLFGVPLVFGFCRKIKTRIYMGKSNINR
jgi:hypothetical protein